MCHLYEHYILNTIIYLFFTVLELELRTLFTNKQLKTNLLSISSHSPAQMT